MAVTLHQPWWLLAAIVLIPLIWRRRPAQALGHPDLSIHMNLKRGRPNLIVPAVKSLTILALLVGLARPQAIDFQSHDTIVARDIVLVVDVSGSMTAEMDDPAGLSNHSGAYVTSPNKVPTKSTVLEGAIQQFLRNRQGDRFASLMFEDDCYNLYPLTDDLAQISRSQTRIATFDGSGTNIEAAIECGLGHLGDDLSTSRSKVLILATDAEASISDEKFALLKARAEGLAVKVYVLGVGDGWQSSSTADLRRFIGEIGGEIFLVKDGAQLLSAFNTIDRLEPSLITVTRTTSHRDLYQYALVAAMLASVLCFIVLGRKWLALG